MIQEVKLLHRTSGGSLVRSDATIEYKDSRIYFLKSPFALKDEIKAMAGSKWHGYSDPPLKMWSVTDCQRNRFQLSYLMGEDAFAWFDRPVKQHEYQRPLMPHQCDLSDHFLTYHYGIMAAEMGCVAGDALIEVCIGVERLTLPIAALYALWQVNSRPITVLGLKGYRISRLRVLDVLHQGTKPVVAITLKSGRQIRVTPDHEIYVDADRSIPACELRLGVQVLSGRARLVDSDPVVTILPAGRTDVYDIRCEHPDHNFRANGIVIANCGKTLSAQEVMERSGVKEWWWIGPKTSLPNIEREFRKWNLDPSVHVEMLTYEALRRVMKEWDDSNVVPQGVVMDECSRCKTAEAQRSKAAQELADKVRAKYSYDGYVIEMSGTPSPKTPVDWWSVSEIAWPGFLKEGSPKAMEARLAFMEDCEFEDGNRFKTRIGWKDDERKCKHCGGYGPCEDHAYEPSFNEVAYLYERLKGLVIIKHKKDCLTLPEKRYRIIECKPNPSTLRAGQAISQSAPNAITGMTLLRELSDGFQYREVPGEPVKCSHCKGGFVDEWYDADGRIYPTFDPTVPLQQRSITCPHCRGKGEVSTKKRITKEFSCPKDAALRDLLDECEETGRIVIFAGFTGSVDHVVELCRKEKWDVVRCDGRGWWMSNETSEEPLDYWANMEHQRVAFVAHPESGGMSFTLTESRMAVYWSNSFKPEYRTQSEDRIHRIGADPNRGVLIVDLIHLPSDAYTLQVIRENRRLELMTMGELTEGLNWEV